MATAPARKFEALDAKREHVPLLIGLTGPSGGGKTFSALRLATGIQEVTGGDIYFIDTESRRALHYADRFRFKHVEMNAPFGSLDYLAALQYCVKQGARVVVVDSMSHEHEGPGGMVDLHDQIVDRMAGDDYAKRERVKMLAWSEPKQKRRALINGILQLNANFIFCFRAKNTSKPVKNPKTGKTEVETMGFMPIAGEEFVFEQTLNALLLPAAGGVPTWHSEQMGERTMIKLPEQFAFLRERSTPLDEKVGAGLARWAAGVERPGRGGAKDEREEEPAPKLKVVDAGPDDEEVPDDASEGRSDDAIAEISAAIAIMDVNSIAARHEGDARVQEAAERRRAAIKAERDGKPTDQPEQHPDPLRPTLRKIEDARNLEEVDAIDRETENGRTFLSDDQCDRLDAAFAEKRAELRTKEGVA